MMGALDGRVALITGAGRGLGREHALELARHGASVMVNDLDESVDEVTDEIAAAGGTASGIRSTCTTWEGAQSLIETAVQRFGQLDILVNNAGILRDRMVFNMGEDDWDAVVSVHGKGHFATTRFACAYWRERAKTSGGTVHGRLVHTTSRSGLFGAAGQSNYAFAKGGIAAFSLSVAREMQRYGVTSNAIAPVARTRLTEGTFGPLEGEDEFDRWDPANVAPFVAYLCSDSAAAITGQVFVVFGGDIQLIEQYRPAASLEKTGRWTVEELVARGRELFEGRSSDLPDRRMIEGLSPIA